MKTYNQLITELSAGTLARYIGKASGQLRNAAARHGQNMLKGKSMEGLGRYLNKSNRYKGTTANYEKMMNREQGIKQAASKLAGKAEEQRLDNIIRSTVEGGAPKKITKPTFDKKDPDGINYLKDIRKDYLKRTKKEAVNMKSYNQFITELNKFEKFLFKQGVKALKKLNPRVPLKTIKKDTLRTTRGLRSDVDNPFVSPRREAENLVKSFQRTIPGQKGANIMQTKGGKYINYDPTRVRQGDDVTAATGAFTMRGQSKAANRFLDKELKAAGKRGEDGRSILKNVGDQHSAIYKAPGFKGNPTDAKIDSTFNKNVLGAPTTTNLPKGAVPDVSKKIKAKSKIKPFKRDRK